MVSNENFLRRIPTTLTPLNRAKEPATSPNGMTSSRTPEAPPIMAWEPMRVNWCTPLNAPMKNMIAHDAVAAQPRAIGHHDVASNAAIMADMGIGHEHPTVSHLGYAVLGPGAHGDILANVAVNSDDQTRRAASIAR